VCVALFVIVVVVVAVVAVAVATALTYCRKEKRCRATQCRRRRFSLPRLFVTVAVVAAC